MGFEHRNCQSELMDQPELDAGSHRRALNGLGRVNWCSGTAGRIWAAVKELALQRGLKEVSILDLASGGGDVVLALARRAAGDGLPVTMQGWDRSDTATAYANERAARSGFDNVSFVQRDVLNDPVAERFDVVISTLFLHHLSSTDAATLLRRMRETARHAVLVDDLRRTRVGYCLAWLGTRILSRSPIVHFDGPVSVQAAWRVEEVADLAERAGLAGARIVRHWPQRFLLHWRQG